LADTASDLVEWTGKKDERFTSLQGKKDAKTNGATARSLEERDWGKEGGGGPQGEDRAPIGAVGVEKQ